jgi:hypothetical protein
MAAVENEQSQKACKQERGSLFHCLAGFGWPWDR